MTWTKCAERMPTEAGWYWAKNAELAPGIVWWEGKWHHPGGEPTHWAGPILPPEEDAEEDIGAIPRIPKSSEKSTVRFTEKQAEERWETMIAELSVDVSGNWEPFSAFDHNGKCYVTWRRRVKP